MKESSTTTCPNCLKSERQIEGLQQQLRELQANFERLQQQLAAAHKNSANSSKPPSSDIVKPPKPQTADGQTARAPGGQPGHAFFARPEFPPEALTSSPSVYRLDCCPACQHALQPTDAAPHVVQQVDLEDTPLLIQQHRALAGWCPHCQKTCYAPCRPRLPRAVWSARV